MRRHRVSKKIGLRQAVKLAEDHAIGILDSMDDGAFWSEDFFDQHNDEEELRILARARNIVMNRVRKTK